MTPEQHFYYFGLFFFARQRSGEWMHGNKPVPLTHVCMCACACVSRVLTSFFSRVCPRQACRVPGDLLTKSFFFQSLHFSYNYIYKSIWAILLLLRLEQDKNQSVSPDLRVDVVSEPFFLRKAECVFIRRRELSWQRSVGSSHPPSLSLSLSRERESWVHWRERKKEWKEGREKGPTVVTSLQPETLWFRPTVKSLWTVIVPPPLQ